MIYAMLYAENADIIGTYESREVALHELAQFTMSHPELQDEVGLRAYVDGRPAGEFCSASRLLASSVAQQHLVDA